MTRSKATATSVCWHLLLRRTSSGYRARKTLTAVVPGVTAYRDELHGDRSATSGSPIAPPVRLASLSPASLSHGSGLAGRGRVLAARVRTGAANPTTSSRDVAFRRGRLDSGPGMPTCLWATTTRIGSSPTSRAGSRRTGSMGSADHALGRGQLRLETMLSLEPFTVRGQGSPQLFQTGESYRQTPLVNYQHPHDLLMEIGATYKVAGAGGGAFIGADLVGAPTLGPTPFMHRESARDNPQVPLTHHFLDSTHISYGVVRGGASRASVTIEASAFRGAEPDDHRTNLEQPHLDSWAARVRYDRGAWHAQVSGGHLHQPEWYEPYDVTRITASVGFEGTVASRPLNVDIGVGWQPRIQWIQRKRRRRAAGMGFPARPAVNAVRSRGARRQGAFRTWRSSEGVLASARVLYDCGVHHRLHLRPGAAVLGAGRRRCGRDDVPDAAGLLPLYGGSSSYHVFLRWRPSVAAAHVH